MLLSKGRPPNPRKMFITHLTAYILQSQQEGSSILLSLDANEAASKTSYSHRQGTEKIYYIFVTLDLIESNSASGILYFDEGFNSDHRAMFMDLDIKKIFGDTSDDQVSAKDRSFTKEL